MIFSSALLTKADAQTYGIPDTLAYLQSIVQDKRQYVGWPFSKLMDSLKIEIKFFSPFAALHYNKTKETSTSFAFNFPFIAQEIQKIYPCLEVYWQPYLNANESSALYTQNNGGGWTSSVAAFYASGIIADIKIRD